jgi:hypothetical protein
MSRLLPLGRLLRAGLVATLFAATATLAGCGACSDEQGPAAPSGAEAPAAPKSAPAEAKGPEREAKARSTGVVTPEELRPLRPEVEAAKLLILAEPVDPAALAKARTELDAAIGAKPDDADAHYWRGRADAREGKWVEALPHFDVARAKDAGFLGAKRWAAAGLVSARRCDAAIPLLDELVGAVIDDANSWYNRGACRFQQQQLPQALADIEKACALGHDLACDMASRVQRRVDAAETSGVPRHGATLPFTAPDGTPGRPAGAAGGGEKMAKAGKGGKMGKLGKAGKAGKAGKVGKLGKVGKTGKLGKMGKGGKAKAKADGAQGADE